MLTQIWHDLETHVHMHTLQLCVDYCKQSVQERMNLNQHDKKGVYISGSIQGSVLSETASLKWPINGIDVIQPDNAALRFD